MFKISHEVPKCYLEYSKEFNDYDYALVHLFDIDKEYLEFYKNSNKEIILDNSAYEIMISSSLRDTYKDGYYNLEKYKYWIETLQPTYYVLPDSKLNNNFKEYWSRWNELIKDSIVENIKTIGVLHGDSIDSIKSNYEYIKNRCNVVALSTESWFRGLDRYNILDNIIDKTKKHHILGCIDINEYKYWLNKDYIVSIDTSAPITTALDDNLLDFNNYTKSRKTIHDYFNIEFNRDTLELIKKNTSIFKEYLYVNQEYSHQS